MLLDTTYYRAGLRGGADTPQVRALEQERLRELFGNIGNIHMIVFEVLYKNPCILQPSPMYELEAGEEAASRLGFQLHNLFHNSKHNTWFGYTLQYVIVNSDNILDFFVIFDLPAAVDSTCIYRLYRTREIAASRLLPHSRSGASLGDP